jgi:hypothetical protein
VHDKYLNKKVFIMALTSGQLNINIGAPNSPTNSDSLYTAFGKIQDNFTNVFVEATSFTSANLVAGAGLSSSTLLGTITIVNTGVTSVATTNTNLTTSASNGAITLGLANTITGLATVSTANLAVTSNTITQTLVVSGTAQIGNISTAGNITAGNIAVTDTTVTSVMKLTPIAAPPASPSQGTVYYDSFINALRVYNGTSWGNVAIV